MKHVLFCFFFFILGYGVVAQKYISEQKAIEDIDFYFSKIDSIHPNVYWQTPKHKIDSFILELKNRCKDSVHIEKFNILLAQGNHFFDSHTGIYVDHEFCVEEYLKTFGDFVFPAVSYSKEGILIKESGHLIMSINGYAINEFVDDIKNELGCDVNPNYMYSMLSYSVEFQKKLMCMGIMPPFKVNIKMPEGRDSVLNIETGESFTRLQENIQHLFYVFVKNGIHAFEIYPENSIALIRFYVCDTTNLESFFSDCFQQIDKNKIKHVFIDVSLNEGGTTRACELFFDHLNFKCNVKAVIGCREKGKLKYSKVKYERNNQKGYRGKIYVYQSYMTTSAGTFIGEMLRNSDRAVLVGTETGGCVPVYTEKDFFHLKNSGIVAYCAHQFYNQTNSRLSRDKNGFLLPDIFYPFNLEKRLELSDCIKIINSKNKSNVQIKQL